MLFKCMLRLMPVNQKQWHIQHMPSTNDLQSFPLQLYHGTIHWSFGAAACLPQDGVLDPTIVITHVLPLDEVAHGFKIFNDKTDNCVKVLLKTGRSASFRWPHEAIYRVHRTGCVEPLWHCG